MAVDQLTQILDAKDWHPHHLIELLQDVQRSFGHVPEEAMSAIAARLSVPAIEVYRVASFFRAFALEPRGKHIITVCMGTACHVRGAPRMVDELQALLGIGPGGTTDDSLLSLETVNCLGACALGPVVVLDGVYHHHMSPGKLRTLVASVRESERLLEPPARLTSVDDLAALRARVAARHASAKATVTVGGGTCGEASGSQALMEAFERVLQARGLAGTVHLRLSGCHGFCEQEPMVVVDPGGTLYCRVAPEDVREIVARTVEKGEVVDRLLYVDPLSGDAARTEAEIPFYRVQDRVVLGQNRLVDPRDVEDYIAVGGYSALAKVLTTSTPEAVIGEISASGLRGRGGGGFPTGRKWEACRAAPGDDKYVICNADEGDPGAYMDRSILEGNPHAVLEGMLIGAYAVGARDGYFYVRDEYPLAVRHARVAAAQARERGLLGEHILGTDFSFDVEIVRGAGAFICGESTALMASLEGKVGEPRPKDVHTVRDGLWHRPTTLNNVETLANVPSIMANGSAWFAAKGTEGSKGTKIFALTGRVRNTGLVEVPMGTSLRSIVFDIGGGAADGREVKAVQTGGPSGGCLPVHMLDLPVDFDTLAEVGSMVGSGGMVVLDDQTCMVDVAGYFLRFLQEESCGKCVPCRLGIRRMLEIVTDISEGRGRPEQLDLLGELGVVMREASLCALGKTAPNPVLSSLEYFREEFETHVRDRRCPAGVCRALIEYRIDAERCTGCGLCRRSCAHTAIAGEPKQPHEIDLARCAKCGSCREVCRFDAVVIA
jgi:NADH:ubiquinone oxidoreductase subunit F (NADH-binding)/NADH:ubiquinone oxidoreductase subunit E/Pyruvate/2-oxoacid:ferredoxin oxidoreductase delta subunit